MDNAAAITASPRVFTYKPTVPTAVFVGQWPLASFDDLSVYLNGTLLTRGVDFTVGGTFSQVEDRALSTDWYLQFPNLGVTGTLMTIGARQPRRTSGFLDGVAVPPRWLNAALDIVTITLRELFDKALKRDFVTNAWDAGGLPVRNAAAGYAADQLVTVQQVQDAFAGAMSPLTNFATPFTGSIISGIRSPTDTAATPGSIVMGTR